MTREEAIERFENVKANALVQKASGVSTYWQNEIDGTVEAIDMAIESLQSENEWIPVSERLPIAEREGQVRGFYLTTNERGQVSVKAFEFTDGYVEYGWNSDFEILAWMPLPKPYGERREP